MRLFRRDKRYFVSYLWGGGSGMVEIIIKPGGVFNVVEVGEYIKTIDSKFEQPIVITNWKRLKRGEKF